jgi:hypothetical protein
MSADEAGAANDSDVAFPGCCPGTRGSCQALRRGAYCIVGDPVTRVDESSSEMAVGLWRRSFVESSVKVRDTACHPVEECVAAGTQAGGGVNITKSIAPTFLDKLSGGPRPRDGRIKWLKPPRTRVGDEPVSGHIRDQNAIVASDCQLPEWE